MKLEKFIDWKRNWPVLLVALLYIPAAWWWGIWSRGAVLRWWRTLEGKMAAPDFFEWEEFIALHSHNNEYPGHLGFYLIIAVILILLLLHAAKVIRTNPAGLSILLGFTLTVLFFSVCLCQSPEKTYRRFCPVNLKKYHQVLENCIRENGVYPAELPTEDAQDAKLRLRLLFLEHYEYHYPGAGRKPGEPNFVVIEDAPRTHAGDLRHRLHSDGAIDSYYPWQTEKNVK